MNEEATNKMIQELIKEKERLLKELEGAKSSKEKGISDEEIQKLREEQEQEVSCLYNKNSCENKIDVMTTTFLLHPFGK